MYVRKEAAETNNPNIKWSVFLHRRQTWLDKEKGPGSRKSGFSFFRKCEVFLLFAT
jgi:hypothetical protein